MPLKKVKWVTWEYLVSLYGQEEALEMLADVEKKVINGTTLYKIEPDEAEIRK